MARSRFRKATLGLSRGKSDEALKLRKSRSGRVLRACDDCRGRKIRCDGSSPCLPCERAHRECTFSREKKSRYKGPIYIEELENKISQLQDQSRKFKSILVALFPGLSMEDQDAIEALLTKVQDAKRVKDTPPTSGCERQQTPANGIVEISVSSNIDESLETMFEATERLDIDDKGHCQYHGDFAGLAFLHQIGERCSHLLNANSTKAEAFLNLPLRHAFASEDLSWRGARQNSRNLCPLPPRATAQRLTKLAFNRASCLLTFILLPVFDQLLDRVYSANPGDFTRAEETFLPLLYAAMAIGETFSGPSQKEGAPATSIEQMKGINYFRAGQALLDAADCRDTTSLQAIVCVIIYLQSSGSMHSCYSYISIAISASLQMGLHRSSASAHLDPVQRETRSRLFWVIQTMETYVTTLLGLPTTLSDEDIDQELPLCVDDDNLTTPSSPLATSRMTAVNAHIRLIRIMRNLVHEIYPRAKRSGNKIGEPYRVNYALIVKYEEELDLWFQSLPAPTPTDSLQPDNLRTQLLLRLAYAHVQMVLYRPFIHHIIRAESKDVPEMRSFACASACIKAAMQIVWIVGELSNRGLLVGAYWFTVYITFFAVMALCMFIIGNPDDPTVEETVTAAEKGRKILTGLAQESVSAGRCLVSLASLFDKISLLCTERRKSREFITSTGAYEQSRPCLTRDGGTDSEMVAYVQPPNEIAPGDLIFNPWFDISFNPKIPSLDLQNNDGTPHVEDQASTQQFQPSLLAMMGPPLHHLPTSTPPLATPVYGDLGPLEEIEYFPPFHPSSENQSVEVEEFLVMPVN